MKKKKSTSSDAELLERFVGDSKLSPDEAWRKKDDLKKERQEIYRLARERGATELNPEEKMRDERILLECIEASISAAVTLEFQEREMDWRRSSPFADRLQAVKREKVQPLRRRYFDQASSPLGDDNRAEKEERFRSFAQDALSQVDARANNEWASSEPKLNRGVRQALLRIDPNADGEVLQDLAEELIAQIVGCRELDKWSISPNLKKFQRHAKDALSLVDPLEKSLLRLESEVKDSLRNGWFNDLRLLTWGEGLRLDTERGHPFGLGLKPEEILESELWSRRLGLNGLRKLLSTPGISPVQGAPKNHARIALFLMSVASFHRLARNEPAGIATDPADGLPCGPLWEFCITLWGLGQPGQAPPTSVIKKAAETFRDQHRRERHSCRICNLRDLST